MSPYIRLAGRAGRLWVSASEPTQPQVLMKKAVLTLALAALSLAASAHSRSDGTHQLGRHEPNAVELVQSVPESVPTFALMLVSLASIGVIAAYLRGRKHRG